MKRTDHDGFDFFFVLVMLLIAFLGVAMVGVIIWVVYLIAPAVAEFIRNLN